MAFFIRTRKLDLSRLERKPQENLSVVHAILRASVKEVNDKIRRVERQFYGSGKPNCEREEVKKWVGAAKSVMTAVHMGQISASWQIEEIMKQANEPTKSFSVDMFDMNKLKECYRKIRDNVPSKFSDILVDCRTILKYLEKYCLSFYEPASDVPFDTAEHYETQRKGFSKAIRTALDHVTIIAEKFRSGKHGFGVSDLSPYGLDLAQKTNSTTLAFLVLFPESCSSIRTACTAMTSWIVADENYSDFVRNDSVDLEKQREESLKIVRDLQHRFHQLGFRQKQMETESDTLTQELEKLEDKELEFMIKEEELNAETNDIQVEIEMKEYRRDELIKNAMNLHPSVLYERYSELSELIRDLKRRLPYAKREQGGLQHKLEWINGKKAERRLLEKKLAQVNKEMEDIDQEKQEQEVEHEHLVRRLELARQILLYKSCPDSMEKIYHERPVEVNKTRLPGHRGPEDPFERTCNVTSQYIENDWPKLYRALPFHPPRGLKTIDKDIQDMTNRTFRITLDEVARKCLYRWRRFHTRAKMEDVNDALGRIKRYDILQKIDQELNPSSGADQVEEEKITYVEEYLIPYVKQVERFDELRAANKI